MTRQEGEEECAPGREEMFPSKTVTEMISSWEELERGGEGGRLSRPGGSREEETGRRKSRNFQSICEMFYGMGREKGGLTDKPDVSVSAQSSFSDVANTLLGPQFVVGGTRPRQKLHFRKNEEFCTR